MLEMNNFYVRSFDSIDEQLQSGLLPQSGAAREPRGPSSTSLAPSTVTAPVCRPYWKRTVDLAGTRCTMFCSFCIQHRRLSPGQPEGRQGEGYGILLLATDAARRPGLNVVLYGDRLFQQYVVDSCAKMEQQRLNYLRFNQNSLELTLSGERRRSRRSLSVPFYAYTLCLKKNIPDVFSYNSRKH